MAKSNPLSAPSRRGHRPAANHKTQPDSAHAPRRHHAAHRHRPAIFCIHKHLGDDLHYDLRLEHQGKLLSWYVPQGPSLDPTQRRAAFARGERPLSYAQFEGVVPCGQHAGIVMLWDRGAWRPETPNVAVALEKGELTFELRGVKLKGRWTLARSRRDPGQWHWIKQGDDWSGALDVTRTAPLSVKSFGDLSDILARHELRPWRSAHTPPRAATAGALLQRVLELARR